MADGEAPPAPRKERAKPGQGACYLRKDGRWECRATFLDGKRRVFYGTARKDAWDKLQDELSTERRTGQAPPPQQETVAAFVDRWFVDVAPMKGLSPVTVRNYKTVLRLYVLPHVGSTKLAHLAARDVQRLWVRLEKDGLAPRTIRLAKAALSVVATTAYQWHLVAQHPVAFTQTPRIEDAEVPPIDADGVWALLALFAGTRLEAAVLLGLLGFRSGEARVLTWRDVDLAAAVVTLRRGVVRVDGEWIVKDPKSRKGKRTMPLPAFATEILQAQRARNAAERRAAGDAWVEHGLVLPNRHGGYQSGQNLLRDFQAHLAARGWPHTTFHQLRHHTTTLLTSLGVDPRVRMALVGHSKLDTHHHYAHPPLADLRAAMDAYGGAIDAARNKNTRS